MRIDTGTVTRSFPDQEVYDVTTDTDGLTLENCISAIGGIFMPFFGFRLQGRLKVGTKVVLMLGQPSYILACLPADPPDNKAADLFRTTTGDVSVRDMGDDDASGNHVTGRNPTDMLEGEFRIANALQVGISFLTHLVKLHGSDRAKVECFLLDDLVRIVSGSFHHMSDFGDYRIINDNGRLNVVWHGTSREHEAWGLLNDKDPKVTSAASGVLPEDPVAVTGRWRFSMFVGHLGNFINMLVSDPVAAIGEIAQSRAGKFRAMTHTDGSYIMQSVADIGMEVVTRVLVPEEQKLHDDPGGDGADDFKEPNSEFLDTWKLDPQRPWTCAFHLREYARWLTQYHAYARFLQQNKDWKVPAETESPEASYGNGDEETERAIPAAQRKPRLTYSCIRIMRDGSHVHLDGYGGCYMTGGGSAVISMPKDIRFEAGRNISMIAGRSVFLKARRNVEIAAVTGSFVAKARARAVLFCEKGTLLLRTLMPRGDAPTSDPVTHRFADPNVGVVIDAPNADAIVSSGGQTIVEGAGNNLEEHQPALLLQSSKGDIHVRTSTDKHILLRTSTFNVMAKACMLKVQDMIGLVAPYINFGDVLVKSGNNLIANLLKAGQVMAGYVTTGTKLKTGSPPHENHVGYSASAKDISISDRPGRFNEELGRSAQPPPEKTKAETVRPVCEYLPASEYPAEPLHQSLAQQVLAVSPGADHPGGITPEDWEFAADADGGDEQARNTHPFPGPSAQQEEYPAEAALHKLSSKTPGEHTPTPTPSERKPSVFKCWQSG